MNHLTVTTKVLDTPEQIKLFRLCTLRSGLKLEVLGMKKRGTSCYSIIKKEFGFKGSKEVVLQQVIEHIESQKKTLGTAI